MDLTKIRRKKAFTVLILFLISFAAVQLLSFSTSLLNPYYHHYDSAYFQSVGKMWTKGFLPFRDFFDHKGPLIHLINALAYLTPFPRLALTLIQSAFFCLTLYFIFGLFLEYMTFPKAAACLFLFSACWSFLFDGGNLTEEYCMPLCIISFVNEFRWLMKYSSEDGDDIKDHPASLFFIDGIFFGLIFLINMKNAATIVLFDFFIAFIMLKEKKIRELFIHIAAALAGSVLPLLPFTAYFALNGGLYDLIMDSVVFIFSYSAARSITVSPIHLPILCIPEILLFISGIWCFVKGKRVRGAAAIFWALSVMPVFITGYKHYFMSGLPLLAMAFILPETFEDGGRTGRFFRLLFSSISLMIAAAAALYLPRTLSTFSRTAVDQSRECLNSLKNSAEMIPENERDSVMVYNMEGFPMAFYIANDLDITFDHPYLTEFHMEFDPGLFEHTLDHLKNNKPLWVIMQADSSNEEITGYIRDNYDLKETFPIKTDFYMGQNDTSLLVFRIRE